MRIPIVCPKCHHSIIDIEEDFEISFCQQCGLEYFKREEIISFCELNDFYEGKFITTHYYSKTNFSQSFIRKLYHFISISSSHIRFIQKSLKILPKQNNIILDLGCGGGHQILKNYGYVVGVDLSISSLVKCKMIYPEVYHCDALSLPFEDRTFDLVFSNQMLGHIPLDIKDEVIKEIYRVTKPGGFSLHTIECDSNAAYFKWAKRYPQLFKRHFIDMYGHYGLELPTENFRRFLDVGFKPICEIAVPSKGYLREIGSYSVLFDNEYKSHSKIIRLLVPIATFVEGNKTLKGFTNVLLGLTVPMANLLTPKDCRDSVEVLYQK